MVIKDEDVREKAVNSLANNRKWTKLDWILYAMTLLEEKDRREVQDKELGTALEWKQRAEKAEFLVKYKDDQLRSLGDDLIHHEEIVKKLRHKLEGAEKTRKELGGRPRKYDGCIDEILKLRAEGKSIRQIVLETKTSRSTVYRLINKYETESFYSEENMKHVRRGIDQLATPKKD